MIVILIYTIVLVFVFLGVAVVVFRHIVSICCLLARRTGCIEQVSSCTARREI